MRSIKNKKKKVVYSFIKRLFDIFFAIIGIVFLGPISIFVKIINLINKDYDPIFYSHTRIGKNGKEFKLYKYRSMKINADEILKEMLKNKEYANEWQKKHKIDKDPRITKVGNILRRSSLDEFPQFINVLLSQMSFIGPRPLKKGELDEHNGDHEIYESIKPGITGWWACSGRSDMTYEQRLEYEYYYIENYSLWLDIKCIFKTIKAVIKKAGAK